MPSVLILSSKISFFLSTFLTNFRAMASAIPIAETSRILAITFDATVKGRGNLKTLQIRLRHNK